MVTRAEWVEAFLADQRCPDTHENLVAVLTWIRSEWGGWAPVRATWNPLNTTLSSPPQTDYNSVGVKNYATFEQGLSACSRTLSLPYYPAIRAALQAGTDAGRTIDAIHASPWGSKPNAAVLAYVRSNLAADSALIVGVGAAPSQPPEEDMPLNAADYQAIRDIVKQELEAAIGGASMTPPDAHATVAEVVKHYTAPTS